MLTKGDGVTTKSARVGAMRPLHRHRRELKCRVMPRHFDFLSVGEEFGDTRDRLITVRFQETHGISTARHFTCIGMKRVIIGPLAFPLLLPRRLTLMESARQSSYDRGSVAKSVV